MILRLIKPNLQFPRVGNWLYTDLEESRWQFWVKYKYMVNRNIYEETGSEIL